MKTVYPQKQLSTADVEEMRKKRLEIYKKHLANEQTNINSFYDTSAKQSQGEDFKLTPDKKVLTAEDFRSQVIDPNPEHYELCVLSDGSTYYLNTETMNCIPVETYRELRKAWNFGSNLAKGLEDGIKAELTSENMDQNPFSYSKFEVEDGTVCYIHKKTGSIISESTYRSLVNRKAQIYFGESEDDSNQDKSDISNEYGSKNLLVYPPEEVIQVFEKMKKGIYPYYPDPYIDLAIRAIKDLAKADLNPVKANEENKSTEKDMVNHPPHYNVGGFEVIDIIQAFTQDLNGIAAVDTANAIKYILRWHNKNGIEDLKKARWYIDHLIKKLEDFDEKC